MFNNRVMIFIIKELWQIKDNTRVQAAERA